jgi:hypothetical protein
MGEAYFQAVGSEGYRRYRHPEAPSAADRARFNFLENVAPVRECFAGGRDHDCRRSLLRRRADF